MGAHWTRRKFLVTTAAAGAAACVRPRTARAAEYERFGGFNVGLQSYTLRSFPVDKALEITKELDLHSIEFFPGHFPVGSTPDQIEDMKSKCAALGIKIMGHGVNHFGPNKEANEKIFRFAKAAGIRNLSADPTPDAFDNLDELVEKYDVRIAIHNHGPKARYNKVDDVLKAISGHHKNIGACADLGHYIRSGEDPVDVIRRLEGRLYGVHLKDFAEKQDKTHGVILGQGQMDVVGVFQALRKVNFPADGCLSLEYEEKANNPLDDVKQCLAIASEAAKKAASGA